ncbi:hypothetical protein SASPL_130054 [Salvia splendens]|uniref:Uncharacterized protein n=1 Tax=Salvia splendens TaxID=180675 RepID=A0A8X8ZJ41_SALSN|nr:hypothetical protein SASPL_130054 [Salvia splendens]
MDYNALAKSKRAHSLHHKKKHHSQQGLKASSPSAGSDDKQASERPAKSPGQQAKERSLQLQNSRALPSNWNRYDDDDSGLASENARESSSQLTEFVMPKSKGADYAHMISEDYSSDVVPLLDDFIGGMPFVLESILEIWLSDYIWTLVRCLLPMGQGMLSWIADDSFEFEDDVSITPQIIRFFSLVAILVVLSLYSFLAVVLTMLAPFLSLNPDALAEHLAKAKLLERLYLQSDLLPLELASAAEAELVELLNSFSDTAVPKEQTIPLSGDAVDILREETSWIVSSKANTESVSSSKNPISKSEIVDDFDSWLDTI